MKYEIDEWARMNNLTPSEFKKEMFGTVMAIAEMELVGKEVGASIQFSSGGKRMVISLLYEVDKNVE